VLDLYTSYYIICDTLWSIVCKFDTTGLQDFYDKEPHRLFWTSSRSACGETTVSGIRHCLTYCEIFILYTKFTNVVTDRIIQPGGPHAIRESEVGNPCFTSSALFT